MVKEKLRLQLKEIRASLSQERRERASYSLFVQFLPALAYYHHVLSFVSFGYEIDTSLLNLFLARTERLLLPKISGDLLKIFRVTQLETQLVPNAFGLLEPSPILCEEINIESVQIALIPALGFDQNNHRLGYGKGYYDRFLKKIPEAETIGVGFKEQFVPHLPNEPTDVSLEKVSLF